MKERSERALSEFNEFYQIAFANSRHRLSDEALALGVDTATASNYLSVDAPRNLPAGLLPSSAFSHELMNYLAARCGGMFVPVLFGKLNEDDRHEFSEILRGCSNLAHEEDRAKRRAIFKDIETRAAKAGLEDSIKQ